jgi:hypothetical protein
LSLVDPFHRQLHVDCAGDGPGSVVAARHRRAKTAMIASPMKSIMVA